MANTSVAYDGRPALQVVKSRLHRWNARKEIGQKARENKRNFTMAIFFSAERRRNVARIQLLAATSIWRIVLAKIRRQLSMKIKLRRCRCSGIPDIVRARLLLSLEHLRALVSRITKKMTEFKSHDVLDNQFGEPSRAARESIISVTMQKCSAPVKSGTQSLSLVFERARIMDVVEVTTEPPAEKTTRKRYANQGLYYSIPWSLLSVTEQRTETE